MIAVTGGNGFVGRALLRALQAAGSPGRGLVRDQRALAALASVAAAPGGHRVVGDLVDDLDWQEALRGVDVVVHAAARVHVMQSEAASLQARYRRVNTEASVRLAHEAVAAGVRRLVYLSSVKVLGESTAPGRCFGSGTPADPRDAYAWSKWEAEEALSAVAARTGLELVVIRPPLVYGPGVGGNFHRLLGWVRRGLPLPLALVDNRRSLIGLRNLVEVVVRACAHPAAAAERWLVADPEPISTAELVRAMAHALGRPPRLVPVPVPVLRGLGRISGHSAELGRLLDDLVVDASRTWSVLGWTPPAVLASELAAIAAAQP
jgi:nucleoside-diphosphate-sugar epimerase